MQTDLPELDGPPEPSESESSTSLKSLVEEMAKALVDDPDSVVVEEIEGANVTIFKLSVAPDEMGRVIGRRGRVANAMRIILRATAAKDGKRVSLDIE